MIRRCLVMAAVVALAIPASAQDPAPLYRVFLADGTGLTSFGEWARVDDRLVFSMPVGPMGDRSQLHLVSLPVQRIDMARTERYADAVRASAYAATRGEADFAQLSSDVARALNRVALIEDPTKRLAAAEGARRSLANWPATHYGYRAADVREIIGVLDEAISGLRASAGQNRFDLSLSTTTTESTPEPLLDPPDHADVVRQLIAASEVVESPAERTSLLQSVVGLIDRAVDLLPAAFARTFRASAIGRIADEQRIDAQYARLRTSVLADAARHAARADVRGLERVRQRLHRNDGRLGGRRPEDVAALLATLDAHLDAAHRLRLTRDQWLLTIDRLRAFQRAAAASITALTQSESSLEDIRALAGPAPQLLRPLALRLNRGARRLALVDPPPELTSVHAVFRSAFSLAENAVQLRLDAARAADVELARRAGAAASGALMLLQRARADLEVALQPPVAAGPTPQP